MLNESSESEDEDNDVLDPPAGVFVNVLQELLAAIHQDEDADNAEESSDESDNGEERGDESDSGEESDEGIQIEEEGIHVFVYTFTCVINK